MFYYVINRSLIMSQAGDKGKLLWSDVLRQRASLKHVEMDNAARLLQNYTENSIPAENSIPNNHRYDAPHQLFDNPHSYHVPLSMLLAPGPYPPHVPPHCREVFLSDEDFLHALGVNRQCFYRLPHWKQVELKRRARLF